MTKKLENMVKKKQDNTIKKKYKLLVTKGDCIT